MGVKVREKIIGSGVWWVFINYRGRRKSKQVGTEKSAYEVKRLLEAKLALGDYDFLDDKPVPTFEDYADSWMKTTVPATCKPSTQDDYQAILDLHVLPAFKSKVINEINRGHVKTFLLTKISEGFAGSTVTHMKNVISGIMNKALDDEVVTVNPVLGLGKIIPSTDTMNEINPLTAQELSQLIATFEEHFSKHFTIALWRERRDSNSRPPA
jgi:integrase